MPDTTELIPEAGACIVSNNVLTGAGRVKWMVRENSLGPADNGWRIFSHIDTEDYLSDADNMQVADFNRICELEPAIVGIWDLPVGSDLQVVDEGDGVRIFNSRTGDEVPPEVLYDPVRDRR